MRETEPKTSGNSTNCYGLYDGKIKNEMQPFGLHSERCGLLQLGGNQRPTGVKVIRRTILKLATHKT